MFYKMPMLLVHWYIYRLGVGRVLQLRRVIDDSDISLEYRTNLVC